MQKKEFFGALLLVSLVSTMMFAGFVSSTPGPTISVHPCTGVTLSAGTFIRVTGTGWTPNTPVITIYWDEQDANHTIALVTPSGTGTFSVPQLEIEGMSVGPHTVIAVQGIKTATTTFTVSVTTPPDDRFLNAIQQLEDELDNMASAPLPYKVVHYITKENITIPAGEWLFSAFNMSEWSGGGWFNWSQGEGPIEVQGYSKMIIYLTVANYHPLPSPTKTAYFFYNEMEWQSGENGLNAEFTYPLNTYVLFRNDSSTTQSVMSQAYDVLGKYAFPVLDVSNDGPATAYATVSIDLYLRNS